MSPSRRLTAFSAGIALVGSGLVAASMAPAQANPAGTGLVISEVYPGGGNSGALYSHDFVELYNPTGAAIDLSGMSIQYRSSANTGTSGSVSSLASAGSVPAGEHFVITLASNNLAVGDPVPNVDFAGSTSVNLSGTSGQIYLAASPTGIDPDGAGNTTITDPAVVDFVGYGTAVIKEGATTAPSPAAGNSTSITRDAANADTDVNGDDFLVSAPTAGGPYAPPPPPAVTEATIPEIQGTGDASTMDGDTVVTEGVVTAAYPSGLFGFYLQTPGSGGALDLSTHTASDGLFVYYPFGAGAVTVQPGDHVRVTGEVDEFAGATQLRIADAATDVVVLTEPAAVPTPVTGVWPDTDPERETLEGMLYTPSGDFTVTNTYSTNQYGEVGLAKGTTPLVVPTEVADAQEASAIAAVVADNAARAIVLDDASTKNYTSSSNQDETPPYVSNTKPVRVGAAATFTDDVIFTEGGSSSAPTYRFQPLVTVTGPDFADSPATFENDRTAAPDEALLNEAGEADLKVASFNVLNYFTTLGDADDDNVGEDGCLAYTDRDGDGNNIRPSCDQRGAWDPQDFARQQEKIVAAINALDADVVGLMEIENSAALGETADEATNALVAALNAAAGAQVWAANPSSADLPPVTEQDFITNAIIYKVDAVDRVGPARALGELSGEGEAFSNAREPIAQAFVPDAGGESVLVVVNHFKSKSSGVDDGTGQGNANPDRVAQAEALRDWVPSVQTDLGVESTLLIGDFNSYSMEDPLQVLYAAGYTNVEQFSGNEEYSYSFGGQSGSLDHILANDAAMDDYTGVDIWNINAGESVAMEYSRWNYHATDFHAATPYRSSDHDPAIMGLDLTDEEPEPEPAEAELKVKATPKKVTEDRTRVKVHVHVKATGEKPTGQVTIVVQDQGTFTGELRNGKFKLRLAKFDTPGTKTIEVTYSGDDNVEGDTETITITVHPAKAKHQQH